MDTGLPGREGCESQGSWIPATPYRPILSKPQPIYTDGRANQLDQVKWLESECFSTDCSQGPQANNGFACLDRANDTNMNGCTNNWEESSAGIDCNSAEASREFATDPMAQWKNVPCSNLLALANAAGRVSANMAAQRNVGTPKGSCISTALSQTDSDPHHLLENANYSFRSNNWTNGNYAHAESQYELSMPQQNSYDLNFPPGTMLNTVSNSTISEFAPITPDKGIRVKSKQVSELQNSSTKDEIHQERHGQNNETAAERVDSNRIQCNKDLLDPVTDVSLAAESTQQMENHNPDKGVIDGIDLNKTPQQKPRRKKHRPKVITEGKPRIRKPVTSKSAVSKESPTGKRKYVRKKGLNKDSTTSQAKAARGSTDPEMLESTKEPCEKKSNFDIEKQSRDDNSTGKPTQLSEGIEVMTPKPADSKANSTGKRKYRRKKGLNKDSTSSPTEPAGDSNGPKAFEPSKKSCRKTLKFDLEDQPRDENPTCKSSIDLNSELQAKDSYTRIQSAATMQADQGIEMIIENTKAGTTYELARSVNVMLKDCMLLPEGQARTRPLPTKTIPRQRKKNAGSRKNNTKSKGQGTTIDQQDRTKHVMLQIDTQASPNDSKCSICTNLIEQGQAQGSKRKFCDAIEHANTSSCNQNGILYHTLQAYQMDWAHFPNIYKKKRTEKGQNSTSSSTSSSITAAKDVTLETICSQSEIETDFSASKGDNWISAPQSHDKVLPATLGEASTGLQDKKQIFEAILAISPTEKLRKKRSRCPTRVRDLASLTRIAECTMQPTCPESQAPMDFDEQHAGNSQRPHTHIEILVAQVRETLTRRKRTNKRNSLVNSTSSRTSEKQKHVILYSGHQFSANTLGALPELAWKHMFSIDVITEQLKHLDINRESNNNEFKEQYALVPYNMRNHEQNALVLYGRDGTVVPFDGSINFVKKRHPRPKVELDEETNRVWKLLLENINNEGIDGTDEGSTKWWEEERKVFRGRVDSFIARMHLVQGDRRFSPWKGSVVDSVVGVFLTQNVSDHLSSSAFMSLAAHFPLKSKNTTPCHVEGSSSMVEEAVDYVLNPEDTIEWNEKMSHQPARDQGSITHQEFEHNEEKEVVSSNESSGSSTGISMTNLSKCTLLNSCESDPETHVGLIVKKSTTEIKGMRTVCSIGDKTKTKDGISFQNPVVSSQSSVGYSIQNAERTRSSSDSNSQPGSLTNGLKLNSFNGSTSFVELLQMTGSGMIHQVSNQGSGNMSSDENSQNEQNQLQTMEHDNQRQEVVDLEDPKNFLGVTSIRHHKFCSYITQESAVEVECCEITREETRSSSVYNINDKKGVTEQIPSTSEFTSQTTDVIELTANGQEAPRSSTSNKQSSKSMHKEKNITAGNQNGRYGDSTIIIGSLPQAQSNEMPQRQSFPNLSGESPEGVERSSAFDNSNSIQQKTSVSDLNEHDYSFHKELNEYNHASSKAKSRRVGKEIKHDYDWDSLRREAEANGRKRERPADTMDSLDWEAVRCADVGKIANTIKERGMNNMLAERIKDFLNRLVREHGSIDLEWLRDVPPDKAKEYLLSIRGLGLKSVECVRLLTLHHLAFPVDTNVGRIAVRLGWVPLQPLPESLQLHLLELYPVLESIQKYLWPRLCKLDQRTLYELHYQMITFGKVFCTKSKPNCNACPMRGECRHFASAFASSRLALPGPEEKAIVSAQENRTPVIINQLPLPPPEATELSVGNQQSEAKIGVNSCEPIIEEPATPEPQCTEILENDIEDTVCEDPDEIPTIKLNLEEFTQTLQNYMQKSMELQEGDMSKALVALTTEAASIPMPKLKNVNRLRTEHQVYELPDSHPLLDGLDKREPDDPGRYLLAIWTPGETANSIQPPERECNSQEHGRLCDDTTCFSCNSFRESESQVVRGTLLIPCRTAMRGSFPLNGTYFQVNEVFADHDSSLCPITVPREWIWNLPRRTVYFGTSVPSIFKGLTTEGIQQCFWRGFVCVRGFDQKQRAPRPLTARLHFPASKLSRTQGKTNGKDA